MWSARRTALWLGSRGPICSHALHEGVTAHSLCLPGAGRPASGLLAPRCEVSWPWRCIIVDCFKPASGQFLSRRMALLHAGPVHISHGPGRRRLRSRSPDEDAAIVCAGCPGERSSPLQPSPWRILTSVDVRAGATEAQGVVCNSGLQNAVVILPTQWADVPTIS